jgi:hypothetical protein
MPAESKAAADSQERLCQGLNRWALRHVETRTVRVLMFGALLTVLFGCMSAAEQEAARAAWEGHDRWGAARCGGRSIDGVCVGGGQ